MKDLFSVGQMLLSTLKSIGDFFMNHPFGDFVAENEITGAWADFLDQPLIAYVIGGGLVAFLTWKLVGFVLLQG